MNRFFCFSSLGLAVLAGGFIWMASTVSAADAVEDPLPNDPLADITTDMTTVVGDLSHYLTNQPTQKKQAVIVGKIDKLIEELEKQCAACRGAGGSLNPSKPLADSVIAGGPGGIGDLHAARKGGKKWGELPPHERDRILQSMTEGFPAHYQRILERYYRQLAEEKTVAQDAAPAQAPAADGAAPPAKSPPADEPKPESKDTQ